MGLGTVVAILSSETLITSKKPYMRWCCLVVGGGAGHDVEVVGHPVVLQGEAEPGPGHHAQHHRHPHGHQATGLVMLCLVVSCPVRIYYRDHGKHVEVI